MRWRWVGTVIVSAAAVVLASVAWAVPTADTRTRPAPGAGRPASAPALVDINSAGRRELMTLPGVGPAEAARIVAGRPYRTKADLVIKNAVPEGVFVSIRHRIVAVQKPAKTARPTTSGSAPRKPLTDPRSTS